MAKSTNRSRNDSDLCVRRPLTPEDIDFDRHIISVNKNYQRLNGKDYIYPPKTEAGYREVVMPKVLENCLKDYLAKLYEVQPTDRIFPYDRGWVGRQMKYGCDHSGTQKIRVHDVRHLYVKHTTKKYFLQKQRSQTTNKW